ncbi:MAG: Holliday junction resolvase RuvX [Candidatus Niyogibacteria bacterium CG10_big_fil_rev_8_21_14_0_10_42_19]|uniref:Putative pre-16S rRNA nuclease n=1 Tax=Candidatus Niyogibacteria bacterium CG10_big_fil_rev_8_21_14_0_10_42_19 TaxID=1974725 RepID=A0A2H0TH11_9BACT|nr:MAG: Holliday junction resolvase RuvX [Candidatus Niyogibacteria bacterium CG10_big_fil_rev_8_21_14_0_10_42_19]
MSRILGIDYGRMKIGIAVSDEGHKLAFPKTTHPNSWSLFLEFLKNLILKEDIIEIVVGLPAQLDGSGAELTPEVKDFAEKLKDSFRLPIHFENESFTSKAVESMGSAPAHRTDASAAALILQSFLDRRNQKN